MLTDSDSDSASRSRRFDPDRRTRLIDVTLDVIADEGVAGTSHRRVASRADVPLGSMTYHFASMGELLLEALTRFAEQASAEFRREFDAATTAEDAEDAVVGLITGQHASARDLVLTHEIYTLAARKPEFRKITRDWMARDQAMMSQHFDPATARMLNALVEGMVLHEALDTEPHDPALTREAVRRIVHAQ
jgi:TetR/AcrR family transcriptional regulator, regulator of biofilm formation and stress response